MAWYPQARRNPAPANCYTPRKTRKIAWVPHRMGGWAPYMREFQHLQETPPRLISAHLTLSLKKGDVEQHVDSDHIAWTQGIRPKDYPFCAERWPLFKGRNPNIDCFSSEMGDGAKPFNAQRELTTEMYEDLRDIARWLWEEDIIAGEPVAGVSIIGHGQISPRRPDDPGKWFMKTIVPELVIAAGGRKPRFHSVRRTPKQVKKAQPVKPGATDKFRIRVLETRMDRLQDEVNRLKGG